VQQPTTLFGVELDVFRRDVEVGGSLVPRQDVRSLPVIQKLSS
jgi:hypothetical protein